MEKCSIIRNLHFTAFEIKLIFLWWKFATEEIFYRNIGGHYNFSFWINNCYQNGIILGQAVLPYSVCKSDLIQTVARTRCRFPHFLKCCFPSFSLFLVPALQMWSDLHKGAGGMKVNLGICVILCHCSARQDPSQETPTPALWASDCVCNFNQAVWLNF